jgi:hypothetical protein
MLAEIAACNAAFQVIKSALQNTGDIASAGKNIVTYFDSKAKLQKAVNSSGKSDKSDLEEFLALEQLREQEEELKQLMIYVGRPGLWGDWISFQAKAARERNEAAKEEQRIKFQRQAKIEEWIELGFTAFLIVGAGIALIIFVAFLVKGKAI